MMHIDLMPQSLPTDPAETAEAAVVQLQNFFGVIFDGDNFAVVAAGVLAACIIVGSAAMASSVAESRLRSRNLHFFLGMFFPIIYPALAFVALPRRKYHRKGDGEAYDLDPSKRSAGAPPPAGPGLPPKQGGDNGDSFSGIGNTFDASVFKGLLFDDSGNARGPFIFTIDDVEVRVERVLDALPEMAVLETINADGKQQTLRIPYGRMNGCREL